MTSPNTSPSEVGAQRADQAELSAIRPELIEPAAIEVVKQLCDQGFEAYLVGGCVRDLLLGLTPKDFDVATDATPEDVRRVFRRSRTVGRRFRIVHVRVGRHLFEVSTFRKHVDEDDDLISTSEDGVILRDNSYGTLEDDTFRRDFTINAMYYDPLEDVLIDKANGMADLKRRELRLIGEPRVRLREDPVRILRAIRFAAKLGFDIAPEVEDGIVPTAELLTAIPPARLFDEMNKLFLAGSAERAWELLCHYELSPILFPATNPDDELVRRAMASTDQRIHEDKPVTPGFLFAVLLWDDFQARITENALQQTMQEAENNAAVDCLREQQLTIAIPRRFSQFIRDVWQLQPRLERRQRKNLKKLLGHPKFRAAYDFLLLRAEEQLVEQEIADWWTEIQETHPVPSRPHADDDADDRQGGGRRAQNRDDSGEDGAPKKSRRRRRRRRPRRRSADGQNSSGSSGSSGPAD
ncbi:MAG: polynucleotide adenylyltransferase PcnB [Pseudomonadota bacterium]